MVLTPQLLQAIKLLQMPNVELSAVHRERTREQSAAGAGRGARDPSAERSTSRRAVADAPAEPGDWASEALETDAAGLAANLGTEVENAFDSDRAAPRRCPHRRPTA